MNILHKVICKCNAIPIKIIPMTFLQTRMHNSKIYVETQILPIGQNNLEKEQKLTLDLSAKVQRKDFNCERIP